MTTALVKIAKFADDTAWENPETVGAGRERFYGRGALTLKPGAAVRINHAKSNDVGRVLSLERNDHPPHRPGARSG